MGRDNGHYQRIITTQPCLNWSEKTNVIDELEEVKQIVVDQKFSTIEMLTPVDRRNRYKIWDGNTGTQLFHAQEGDIGCCLRSCCQGSREFEMPFKDQSDRTAFTLNKARSASAFGCCAVCPKMCNTACCSVCCGFTKDLSNLTVEVAGNEFYIVQIYNPSCGKPIMEVRDIKDNNKVYYTLTLDSCCPSAYNCTDVVYGVHDAKNQLVAHVTKHWGGGAETCKACCLECYNANTFVIDFEAKQTTREKIGLLGATLLIDFSYYQFTGENN